MNKYSIVLSLIIIFIQTLFCQGKWNFVNPSPTGYALYDAWYTNQEKLWVVGEFGTLLSTTDYGLSWKNYNLSTNKHLYGMQVIDDRIWIVGDGGIILSSTNAGASWDFQNSGTKSNLNHILFMNHDVGFAMGINHFLLRTANGGLSWNLDSVSVALPKQYGQIPFNDFYFISPTKGWIASGYYSPGGLDLPARSWGALLYTTNAGISWSIVDSGRTAYCAIFFLDSLNGWISTGNVDTGSVILRTTDGGQSWKPGEKTIPWTRIHFITPLIGWALYGNILGKTIDGGRTWQTLTNPSGNGIRFSDSMNGWLIGSSGKIYRTTDSGETWSDCTKRLDITYASLRDVIFVSSSIGWIGGQQYSDKDTALVLHTTNSGATWERQNFPYNGGIYGFWAIDETNLWAIADSLAFSTTDGGKNWIKRNVRDEEWIFRDIYFRDPNWGILLGSKALYKTTNGGTSWNKQIGFDVQFLKSIRFANSFHGWIVAHPGLGPEVTYETTDGGTNWNLTALNFRSISFVDSIHGFALADSSHIFRTNNGGISWFPVFTGSLTSVFWTSCLSFADTSVGWIWGSAVHKTTDGGSTWSPEDEIHGKIGWIDHGFYVDNSQSAWAVAADDRIFRYGSIPTKVSINNVQVYPKDFALFQNYPNPFNSGTIISYTVSNPSHVLLKIYNLLGQEVATLVDEMQNPGIRFMRFDASNFASGIYFYRLSTDKSLIVKTMLLLK